MDDYDEINPPHYTAGGGVEPYEFISSNNLGYTTGSIIKYLTRFEISKSLPNSKKGGVGDLLKAQWYLDQLIERATEKSKNENAHDQNRNPNSFK